MLSHYGLCERVERHTVELLRSCNIPHAWILWQNRISNCHAFLWQTSLSHWLLWLSNCPTGFSIGWIRLAHCTYRDGVDCQWLGAKFIECDIGLLSRHSTSPPWLLWQNKLQYISSCDSANRYTGPWDKVDSLTGSFDMVDCHTSSFGRVYCPRWFLCQNRLPQGFLHQSKLLNGLLW
jgi:hypothetical protein